MKLTLSLLIAFSTVFSTHNFSHELNKVMALDLTQAENYYHQGDYESAIESLKNVINEAKQKGDIVLQSQSLINLALIYLNQQEFLPANKIVKEALILVNQIDNQDKNKPKLLNFALEIKGEVELQIASPEIAIKTWQQSSEIAYQRKDINQFIYAEIKQLGALQELGLYRQALEKLTNIQPKLEQAPQNLVTAKAWQTLGEMFSKTGDFSSSELALNKALTIAKNDNNQEVIANILIAQGDLNFVKNKNEINNKITFIKNLEKYLKNIDKLKGYDSENLKRTIKENQRAIDNYLKETNNYYEQAINTTDDWEIKIIANLAILNLFTNYDSTNISENLTKNIDQYINLIPPGKNSINYRLTFAKNLLKLDNFQYNSLILEQLQKAYKESENNNYLRGKSNALGYLGTLYFSANNLQESQILTAKALYLSQQINASDLTYQWQWQLGRIARQNNQRDEAISAYNSAINILQSLRADLVGINNDLEFDFRDNIEPVYREFVDILLTPNATNEDIKLARNTIDSLQVAELDNFFQNACLEVKKVNLEKVIDQQTAIFYPIILPDRLEVIVSIGNESLHRHSININEEKIGLDIEILRDNLGSDEIQDLNATQKSLHNIYNYLLEPVAQKLVSSKVKNLVFVADSVFKNIPMSALFDGKKYLVENYNIAVAPSLQLLPPTSFQNTQLNLVLSGLSAMNQNSEIGRNFNDLPGVATEINKINQLIPKSQILLDNEFTQNQLQNTIDTSLIPIIHIATHGQFSSQKEDTFLLTWDEKIGIEELENIFQSYNQKQPLELLVLSACETAVGDKRATLGLAGISLKAGARTTVASLWSVVDESTQILMSDFYQQLKNPSLSKAEALRNAQIEMINNPQFNHPSYWSAFILIGNWL